MKRSFPLLAAGLLGTTMAVGCRDEYRITRYSVPRPHAPAPARRVDLHAGDPNPHAAPRGRARMLAAIVPDDARTWFFKLIGPDEPVAEHAERFRELIASVRIENGSARWQLPEGWQARPASGMRYATIALDTPGDPLEVSVTPLRTPPGDFQEYVRANVDRWRQQLGLPPASPDNLSGAGEASGEVTPIKLGDGGTALVVNLVGEAGTSGAGEGMSASAHPPFGGTAPPGELPGRAPAPSLTYETPPSWTPGKADGMREAAFEVHKDSRRAEITVIALPASSSDLLANVNRWREQVRLDPITPAELAGQREDFAVGGETGHRVKLLGPPNVQPREGILGVICTHGDQTWFFKMKGDAELVEGEQDRFDAFVRNVRFDAREGTANGP
jgi:hypothetical protein